MRVRVKVKVKVKGAEERETRKMGENARRGDLAENAEIVKTEKLK